MRCSQCQHANPETACFCNICGTRMGIECIACHRRNPFGSRFCSACGQPLAAQASVPPASDSFSPTSYTPKYLADKILISRSALEGERKQVTVLFCDIADSSQLVQQVDPEVMYQLMDQILRLMAEAVHRYDGTVNQYLGDGIMALFGAPVALEDHAVRAVQAGLAIQETINGYNAQLQRDYGVEVRVRLGLNTGLVVVGRIGDDLRMDYTAVGNTTYLAARLQALAEPGTMLITEATNRLVEGYIRRQDLGSIDIRGQREPVLVYRVTGRRQWRPRLEISAERGLTPIVGRQGELTLLHDALARVAAGHGQVISIVGEAGVGKSRLLHEFHLSLAREQVTWITGHCVGYAQDIPYMPILDSLRRHFHLEDEDNPLQIRDKLRQGVQNLASHLMPNLPFLEALFGLPGAATALHHLVPQDQQLRTFETIRALAMAGGQRRPLVLVYENLHWIDHTSEACLAFLIDSLATTPILLLTTHRPGYTVRWADKTYYQQIALNLLDASESAVMTTTLLGTQALPPELQDLLMQKTGGNPLFIEEIVHSLREQGLLVQHQDSLSWTGNSVEFPETMQDIIRARIDRLAEPVKRTMQTATVIGREFGLRLLSRLVPIDVIDLQAHLAKLKQVELIHEKGFFPEAEYRFKHAVIQDTAYQSLLGPQRQKLHGAVACALEELAADLPEKYIALLAYHYGRSTHQDKALAYALQAGDRAARLYSHAEASAYYAQALTLLPSLQSTTATQQAQIDAVCKLAAVGTTRLDLERDQRNLEEARTLAEALHDDARLVQVLYWLGRLQYVRGHLDHAMTYVQESLISAEHVDDAALIAPPINLVGRIHWLQSDYAKASQMLVRSAMQMQQLGNPTEEATAAGFAGWAFGFLGAFAEALTYVEHGLRVAQKLQNPFAIAAAYFYRAGVYSQRGNWEQALADYEATLQVATQAGDRFRIYLVQFMMGHAYVMTDNLTRGRALLEDSLAYAEQLGSQFLLAWPKTFLAACLLALGTPEAAPALCYEAIALAEATGDKYGQSMAHRTLAEALYGLGPANQLQAEAAMELAIGMQQAISVQPELARSYLRYAYLLQEQGQTLRARAYLAQAIPLFQQFGMTWDLAQAEHLQRKIE